MSRSARSRTRASPLHCGGRRRRVRATHARSGGGVAEPQRGAGAAQRREREADDEAPATALTAAITAVERRELAGREDEDAPISG